MHEVTDSLWVESGSVVFFTQSLPTRMTAIRLSGGDLLLHSPAERSEELGIELSLLGRVAHLVAPNRYHHLSLGAWLEACPEARSYAAPGLPEKRKDLRFDEVLEDQAPAAWKNELDQLVFSGLPIFNEVVFRHRESGTLLLTDLAFNLHHVESAWSRFAFWLDGIYGNFGPSRLTRLMFRREAAREQLARILDWDFDRVIMAHGDILETGGKDAMRDAFSWL